eukprot:329197_1
MIRPRQAVETADYDGTDARQQAGSDDHGELPLGSLEPFEVCSRDVTGDERCQGVDGDGRAHKCTAGVIVRPHESEHHHSECHHIELIPDSDHGREERQHGRRPEYITVELLPA